MVAGAFAFGELLPAAACASTSPPFSEHSRRMQLLSQDVADALIVRRADPDQAPHPGGVALRFKLYDPEPHIFRTSIIPRHEILPGLYVRGSVPFSLRVDLDETSGGVVTRLVFQERAQVRVYREVYEGTTTLGDWVSYSQIIIEVGQSHL